MWTPQCIRPPLQRLCLFAADDHLREYRTQNAWPFSDLRIRRHSIIRISPTQVCSDCDKMMPFGQKLATICFAIFCSRCSEASATSPEFQWKCSRRNICGIFLRRGNTEVSSEAVLVDGPLVALLLATFRHSVLRRHVALTTSTPHGPLSSPLSVRTRYAAYCQT
jgi:hypothetical protein